MPANLKQCFKEELVKSPEQRCERLIVIQKAVTSSNCCLKSLYKLLNHGVERVFTHCFCILALFLRNKEQHCNMSCLVSFLQVIACIYLILRRRFCFYCVLISKTFDLKESVLYFYHDSKFFFAGKKLPTNFNYCV